MLTLFFENVELLFLAKNALHFKVIINHALSKSLIVTLIKKKTSILHKNVLFVD